MTTGYPIASAAATAASGVATTSPSGMSKPAASRTDFASGSVSSCRPSSRAVPTTESIMSGQDLLGIESSLLDQ